MARMLARMLALLLVGLATLPIPAAAQSLDRALIDEIITGHRLSQERAEAARRVLASLRFATQGVAGATRHPVSREQCQTEVLAAGRIPADPEAEAICGRPHMAPLVAAGRPRSEARVCIDRFEFPGLPCQYPVTWVTPREAQAVCRSMGKRLCDAAEWEGACAGSYAGPADGGARDAHNRARRLVYAYGAQRRGDLCGFGIGKSPGCDRAIQTPGGDVRGQCGTNTAPAGWFHACVSASGVYDLHGNAAEHMNLPLSPAQRGSAGGQGVTEMKGSWFAFSRSATQLVHPDDCHWREPGWHRTTIDASNGHANYHLGFRCCADVR